MGLYYFTFIVVLLAVTKIECQQWKGRIVFEDNFEGNSLDLSKWEYQEACGNAKRERMQNKEFTSGRIRQKGSGFAYGAFVVKARLARGDHLWPAIWMMPLDNDCRYEEIDIAEYRGQPGEARNLEMAAHWGRSWKLFTPQGNLTTTPYDLSAGFHEFAVLWLPSKIQWFVDNKMYYEVPLTDGKYTKDPNKLPCKGKPTPFIQPSNFIFNVAVGGPFFDNFKEMNLNTWTKPTMEIDWVRVYQE